MQDAVHPRPRLPCVPQPERLGPLRRTDDPGQVREHGLVEQVRPDPIARSTELSRQVATSLMNPCCARRPPGAVPLLLDIERHRARVDDDAVPGSSEPGRAT